MQGRIESLAHLVEDLLQVAGQFALELHAPPVDRVREREACGMEERALEMRDRADVARDAAVDAAVERVADDRMADRAQVDADLVRAAGVDGDARERQYPAEVL